MENVGGWEELIIEEEKYEERGEAKTEKGPVWFH